MTTYKTYREIKTVNILIRLEEEKDYKTVEYLTREAFWDLYHPGCSEHLIVHKIRKVPAFVKELSFVACDKDHIVGSIIYSRAKVIDDKDKEFEILCMGPNGLELSDGALNGISGKFYESQVFKVEDKELEEFEQEFPYKEKHITDTQFKEE